MHTRPPSAQEPFVSSAHAPGQAGARTGQLTAVMRAARAVSMPKVLRVGVVHKERIVSERLCDAFPVTLGETEDATLVVPGFSRVHALLVKRNGVTELCLTRGMKGRVLTENGPIELESAIAAAAQANRPARIPLTEAARGRVDVGGVRILFQFVERPAPRTTPKLPLAVKNGHSIDWRLAMICAMSFLAHFGVLGAMYSDWADPIVSESYTVGALVDLGHKLPPSPIEEPKDTVEKQVTKDDATKKDVAKKDQSDHASDRVAKNDGKAAPTKNDHDATLMAARADGMMLGLLTASQSSAPATDAALRRSEIPAVDLSHAADANIRPDSELAFHSTTPIRPGESHDISTIGDTHKTTIDKQPVARDVTPSFTFDVTPMPPTTHIDHLDQAVAKLRPGFRKCYTDGLSKDASQQGALVVRAKIAPTGEVASVTVMSNTGLSSDVAECIARKVRNADFEAPGGTGSTVDIPVKFVKQ